MSTVGTSIGRIATVLAEPDEFYFQHAGLSHKLLKWIRGRSDDMAMASLVMKFLEDSKKELEKRYLAPIKAEIASAVKDIAGGKKPSISAHRGYWLWAVYVDDEPYLHSAEQELKSVRNQGGHYAKLADQIQELKGLSYAVLKAIDEVSRAIAKLDTVILGATISGRIAKRDQRIAALAGHAAEGIHYAGQLRNAVLEVANKLKAIAELEER